MRGAKVYIDTFKLLRSSPNELRKMLVEYSVQMNKQLERLADQDERVEGSTLLMTVDELPVAGVPFEAKVLQISGSDERTWICVKDRDGEYKWFRQEMFDPERFATEVDANYQVTVDDYIILADSDGGPITVTLPDAATSKGRIYTVKRTGSNNVVVQP
jgi:hypothetical protein